MGLLKLSSKRVVTMISFVLSFFGYNVVHVFASSPIAVLPSILETAAVIKNNSMFRKIRMRRLSLSSSSLLSEAPCSSSRRTTKGDEISNNYDSCIQCVTSSSSSSQELISNDDKHKQSEGHKSNFWPPWPFDKLGRTQRTTREFDGVRHAPLFLIHNRERVKMGMRQLKNMVNEAAFHLPAGAPPLFLLGFLPKSTSIPLARNLALISLGLAVSSWANDELSRTRRLAPLPLLNGDDVNSIVLPPFLPEAVVDECDLEGDIDDINDETNSKAWLNLKLKAYKKGKQRSRTHWDNMKRNAIMEELLALQSLKKKNSPTKRHLANNNNNNNTSYALITGASKGLGRALAVQFARLSIPSILVARDADKLTSLADELESYYGVRCVVIPADLTQPDAPRRLHNVTTTHGLVVDILVNNAGLSQRGEFTDFDNDDMIRLNVGAVANLARCYGADMKQRRRGRILFVSSVVGALSAGTPNVAAYAATKAFEKTLAGGLGREMERYGVGVTCLLPGAIKNTQFAKAGDVEDALCWRIPFYPMTPEVVAKRGVMAVLRGEREITVGFLNKVLLKGVVPFCPTRITTMIAEMAWSPFHFAQTPAFLQHKKLVTPQHNTLTTYPSHTNKWPFKRPPKVLTLQEDTSKAEVKKEDQNISKEDKVNNEQPKIQDHAHEQGGSELIDGDKDI